MLIDNAKRYKMDICTTKHDNEVFDDDDTTPALRRGADIRFRAYCTQQGKWHPIQVVGGILVLKTSVLGTSDDCRV